MDAHSLPEEAADGSADGVGTTIAAQQQSCCINVEHGVVIWEFEGPHGRAPTGHTADGSADGAGSGAGTTAAPAQQQSLVTTSEHSFVEKFEGPHGRAPTGHTAAGAGSEQLQGSAGAGSELGAGAGQVDVHSFDPALHRVPFPHAVLQSPVTVCVGPQSAPPPPAAGVVQDGNGLSAICHVASVS